MGDDSIIVRVIEDKKLGKVVEVTRPDEHMVGKPNEPHVSVYKKGDDGYDYWLAHLSDAIVKEVVKAKIHNPQSTKSDPLGDNFK